MAGYPAIFPYKLEKLFLAQRRAFQSWANGIPACKT